MVWELYFIYKRPSCKAWSFFWFGVKFWEIEDSRIGFVFFSNILENRKGSSLIIKRTIFLLLKNIDLKYFIFGELLLESHFFKFN